MKLNSLETNQFCWLFDKSLYKVREWQKCHSFANLKLRNRRKSEDLRNNNFDGESKTLNIRVENEMKFTDQMHIENHLKYLFRVDPKQEWTNDESKGNFAVYFDEKIGKCRMVFFNKTLEELNKLSEIIKLKINAEVDFNKNGRMLRIERLDKDVRFTKGDLEFGRKLYEAIAVADKIKPICVVGHQDQHEMYLHWHLVYVNHSGKSFVEILK